MRAEGLKEQVVQRNTERREAHAEARRQVEEERRLAQQEQLCFEREAERKRKTDLEKQRREAQHRLLAQNAGQCPKPAWFCGYEEHVNIGFVGSTGTGKSSLINRWLGGKRAAVAIKECTMEPKPFPSEHGMLWDLPGAGTELFPLETYVKTMGLHHFTGLIIVTCSRFTEIDSMLFREAQAKRIPSYLVRNKADVDMENNEEDKDMPPWQTLRQLKKDACENLALHSKGEPVDSDRVFVISTRRGKYAAELDGEFDALVQKVRADTQTSRGSPAESSGGQVGLDGASVTLADGASSQQSLTPPSMP